MQNDYIQLPGLPRVINVGTYVEDVQAENAYPLASKAQQIVVVPRGFHFSVKNFGVQINPMVALTKIGHLPKNLEFGVHVEIGTPHEIGAGWHSLMKYFHNDFGRKLESGASQESIYSNCEITTFSDYVIINSSFGEYSSVAPGDTNFWSTASQVFGSIDDEYFSGF